MTNNHSISYNSKRRHTLPSTSFVDPAIIQYFSTAASVIQDDQEEEDDQRTTISTISLPQQLDYQTHYHRSNHKQSNLDQLWTRQEKYDNLELRLLALEKNKKRFEDRLQALEQNKSLLSPPTFLLQQTQPMKHSIKPTTTTTTTTTTTIDALKIEAHDEKMLVTQHPIYIQLLDKYQTLQSKYNAIQNKLEEKEKVIQNLLSSSSSKNNNNNNNNSNKKDTKEDKEEAEASYKEEDGFLIFDTTNMNGEIIHCKVKIPPVPLASPPASRVGSPHYQHHHHHQQQQQQSMTIPTTPLPTNQLQIKKKNNKKSNNYNGLNFNAPEWKHPTICFNK